MTREEAIVMQKAIRDNLHETGKDYPYRDDVIPLMKESCDMAIKSLEQETVSRESYDHEYFLRKELELKIAKVESVLAGIKEEINSPNRGICDYYIVDRIEEIIDKYKAESEEE